MKGIIALRMCDMSKYGGLPLEYGTVPAPVWRNIHPRLQMGTAARARAGVGVTASALRADMKKIPGRSGNQEIVIIHQKIPFNMVGAPCAVC